MDTPTYLIPNDVAKTTGPLVREFRLYDNGAGTEQRKKIVGYLLGWGFFGVLSMQVYIYHLAYQREPLLRRALVYGIYLLMLVQTILLTQTAFRIFGSGYGDLKVAHDVHDIWFSIPVITAIVAFGVQGYYACHIYGMCKNMRVALVIGLLAAVQLVGGVLLGVFQRGALEFSKFIHRDVVIATAIWNGAGTICDLIITACMSYFYLNSKSPHKFKSAEVPNVFRFFVQSGGFLAIIAITNTVLSLLPGKHTYFQTTVMILGATYANTLMALFNNRVRIFRPSRYLYNDVSEVAWEEGTRDNHERPRTTLNFATPSVLGISNDEDADHIEIETSGGTEELQPDSNRQSRIIVEKVEHHDREVPV